jgi:hypothetical protein
MRHVQLPARRVMSRDVGMANVAARSFGVEGRSSMAVFSGA